MRSCVECETLQRRLLMALCAEGLFLRNGAAATALGDLLHCLSTLTVENFFRLSSMALICVS